MSLVALKDKNVAILLLRVFEDYLVDLHRHVQFLGGFYSHLFGIDVVPVLLELFRFLWVVQKRLHYLLLIMLKGHILQTS